MKSKFLIVSILLAGVMKVNSQDVQNINETGFGIENGVYNATNYAFGATHIGYKAGYANDGKVGIGERNTFVGAQSGHDTNSGYDNAFLGYFSGTNNTSGRQNAFLGAFAGEKTTTGSQNVFLGFKSGHENTIGYQNVFAGYYSGYNTMGNQNSFYGPLFRL